MGPVNNCWLVHTLTAGLRHADAATSDGASIPTPSAIHADAAGNTRRRCRPPLLRRPPTHAGAAGHRCGTSTPQRRCRQPLLRRPPTHAGSAGHRCGAGHPRRRCRPPDASGNHCSAGHPPAPVLPATLAASAAITDAAGHPRRHCRPPRPASLATHGVFPADSARRRSAIWYISRRRRAF